MSGFAWLWQSLWGRLPSPWIEIALTVFAILAGTFLGDERQKREKPAGLRTLVLVCLGATIYTMTGFAFTSASGDSGRVAAQIVTGIGFLGAGVILHGRRLTTGVTTAAVIWVAAAIGMTIGAGYPIAGLGLSFTVNRFLKLAVLFETLASRSARRALPDRVHAEQRADAREAGAAFHPIRADWRRHDMARGNAQHGARDADDAAGAHPYVRFAGGRGRRARGDVGGAGTMREIAANLGAIHETRETDQVRRPVRGDRQGEIPAEGL
jgi:uncharacterized membrane protein YhiD involved in acid resistance